MTKQVRHRRPKQPGGEKFHHDISAIRIALLNWYAVHRRDLPWRRNKEPYGVWVSEVMLQQTQVKTVLPYYERFMRRFADVNELAAADVQAVLKVWEGLGYYARARNLHKAAVQVAHRYAGVVPDEWTRFRALPGVGDYIAAAVLSIALNQAYAVVDGNVKRVLARLFTMPEAVNTNKSRNAFQALADRLIDPQAPGSFNQAVMELGALLCTPRQPDCARCPLHAFCGAYIAADIAGYPRREKKEAVPKYHVAVGVVRRNGRILITRRKSSGLLGGLWEFPGGKLAAAESSEQAVIREIAEETGLEVTNLSLLTRIKHAYTHFKIEADIFVCDHAQGEVKLNGPVDFRWIVPAEIENFPFPKANHKFFAQLLRRLAEISG